MGKVLTKSEFARRGGVDPAAVSMWISRGHITSPALLEDGGIVVELAVAQLRERLDHARHTVDLSRFLVPDEAELPPQSAAAMLIERARQQKIEENDLRLRRLRREELERAGELVRADAAAQAHGRHYEELLSAIEQFLPEVAMKLGADREGVALMRREWRAFRERQAQAAEQRAAVLSHLTEAPRGA